MKNYKYDYNGIGRWLRGPEAAQITLQAGLRAKVLYQSVVAHRSGHLSESAAVTMSKGSNGRPVATLTVGNDEVVYGAAHEFGFDDGDLNVQAPHHDLLTVLGMLR